MHGSATYPPDSVTFNEASIDTQQANWQLHGVSDNGENEKGYDTTCDMTVVKRNADYKDLEAMMGVPEVSEDSRKPTQ